MSFFFHPPFTPYRCFFLCLSLLVYFTLSFFIIAFSEGYNQGYCEKPKNILIFNEGDFRFIFIIFSNKLLYGLKFLYSNFPLLLSKFRKKIFKARHFSKNKLLIRPYCNILQYKIRVDLRSKLII